MERSAVKTFVVACGVVVVAFGIGIHLYRFSSEWRHLQRATELGILVSSSFALLQLVLVVAFALLGLGVSLGPRRLGRVTAIAGILGVLLGYCYWYSYSSIALRRFTDPTFAQHPELIPSHTFGLIGGYWWDVAIPVVTILSAVFLIMLPAGVRAEKRLL